MISLSALPFNPVARSGCEVHSGVYQDAQEKLRITINPPAITSTNLNGGCERFIETIKLERLSKFIVFGKRHLDDLVTEFTDYYNRHRAHSSRDHLPPIREVPTEVALLSLDQIVITSHVGGLVKSFDRKTVWHVHPYRVKLFESVVRIPPYQSVLVQTQC